LRTLLIMFAEIEKTSLNKFRVALI
jgi:hypothetical protein